MSPYSVNILVMLITLVIQMVLTSVLVQERSFKGPGTGAVSGLKALPNVLSDALAFGIKDRFTLIMMLSSAFLGFGLLAVELLWQPRALELMDDSSQTWIFGVLAAGYFLSSSVGNLFATRISQSFGNNHLKMLTFVRAVSGLTLIILSWMTGMLEFAVLYLLLYLIFGVANSPHAAVFNARIPKERRSTLMSFESLMLQIGGLLGSLTIGWLAQASGIASAWTVAGTVLLISSVTYGFLWWKGRKKITDAIISS
jgi:MFS family permease